MSLGFWKVITAGRQGNEEHLEGATLAAGGIRAATAADTAGDIADICTAAAPVTSSERMGGTSASDATALRRRGGLEGGGGNCVATRGVQVGG